MKLIDKCDFIERPCFFYDASRCGTPDTGDNCPIYALKESGDWKAVSEKLAEMVELRDGEIEKLKQAIKEK